MLPTELFYTLLTLQLSMEFDSEKCLFLGGYNVATDKIQLASRLNKQNNNGMYIDISRALIPSA